MPYAIIYKAFSLVPTDRNSDDFLKGTRRSAQDLTYLLMTATMLKTTK